MITNAHYNADDSVTAGPIEGQTWSGITPSSRFWEQVQEWVAVGNTIAPYVEPPPTTDNIKSARQVAYREEADPLFFKWQRGEGTEQEWLDAIADIRARYPYPD